MRNMDEDIRAYQLRKTHQDSKPSMGAWILVIAFGVFLGNMASYGVEKGVQYWEFYQLAKALEMETQKMSEKRAVQQKLNEAQAKQSQIENQNKSAALRQATETCNFWQQQILTENTPENRMHRDQACNLMRQFR